MVEGHSSGYRGLEAWYAAHFAFGAVAIVFIPILIPTFIMERTGSATDVGLIMAIIGVGAVAAPIVGWLADRYRAFRAAQLSGLIAFVIGALCFAFSEPDPALYAAGAAFLGLGAAMLLMINPIFIVSAAFDLEEEALRLARLNQTSIVGSLAAGAGLAVLTKLGLSFAARFIVMAGVSAVCLIVTAFSNRVAADRILAAEASSIEKRAGPGGHRIKAMLLSDYGVYLLAVFAVTVGHGVIMGQYPNYMGRVFGVTAAASSAALSASALLSLVVLSPLGIWMSRSGPGPVWLGAVGLKIATMVGLITLTPAAAAVHPALPLGFYVLYLQGIVWVDMAQPALASRASLVGAGTTQGTLMLALALGYSLGTVVSGLAADRFGFSSLPWAVGGASIAALALGIFALTHLPRKREEAAVLD